MIGGADNLAGVLTDAADVTCREAGTAGRDRWSVPVRLSAGDRAAVDSMERAGVLAVDDASPGVRLAGTDHVGVVRLPSGRRVRVRSKVDGLTLLDWLAYLGDCPPAAGGRADEGWAEGADVHALLAAQFLRELETLTRHHLRRGYVATRAETGTVRGRVLLRELARNTHRLPAIPQSSRTRALGTPPNRLLAAALDRAAWVLPLSAADARARAAAMRDAWADVPRDLPDLARAVADARWAPPPGYGPALRLAALVLGGGTPGAAAANGPAMLLSLAGVWERGLRRMLHELQTESGWVPVPDARRTRRWHDGTGLSDPARRMTADAIVARGGRRWVLDAKYKCGYGAEDRDDRFQVTAYALAFAAGRGSLVYPTAGPGAGRCRVLLREMGTGGQITAIDSVELPMAAGPHACRAALLGLMRD